MGSTDSLLGSGVAEEAKPEGVVVIAAIREVLQTSGDEHDEEEGGQLLARLGQHLAPPPVSTAGAADGSSNLAVDDDAGAAGDGRAARDGGESADDGVVSRRWHAGREVGGVDLRDGESTADRYVIDERIAFWLWLLFLQNRAGTPNVATFRLRF